MVAELIGAVVGLLGGVDEGRDRIVDVEVHYNALYKECCEVELDDEEGMVRSEARRVCGAGVDLVWVYKVLDGVRDSVVEFECGAGGVKYKGVRG